MKRRQGERMQVLTLTVRGRIKRPKERLHPSESEDMLRDWWENALKKTESPKRVPCNQFLQQNTKLSDQKNNVLPPRDPSGGRDQRVLENWLTMS